MNDDNNVELFRMSPEQEDRVRAAAMASGHPSLREALNGDGGSTGFWGWAVARALEHFSAQMEEQAVAEGEAD